MFKQQYYRLLFYTHLKQQKTKIFRGYKMKALFRNGLKQNNLLKSEAATGGVLWKKLFLKIGQYLRENACVGVSLQ